MGELGDNMGAEAARCSRQDLEDTGSVEFIGITRE